MSGGLHFASRARGVTENAVPSRSRDGRLPRRLTRAELGDWIDHLCQLEGEGQLNAIRDQSRQLASVLNVPARAVADIDKMIGAALGTKEPDGLSRSLQARGYGHPYDQGRARLFDVLVKALRESPPQSLPSRGDNEYLPFYEAYFSNFIEGTEFTLDEALRIVYDNDVPVGRTGDAHDVVGTYLVVNDHLEMTRLAGTPQEFIDLVRSRHARIMAGRPDKHPGQFKTRTNQAGATQFVDPNLVEGTLTEGFQRLSDLDTPWERSVLTMFVVSEVHPFDDGNGRTARVMMNAELEAGGNMRIIVPTVFREDCLGALRRFSRDDDPSVLIKALRYANDWTARINFSDLETARQEMEVTNAFELPEPGNSLLLPSATLFGSSLQPIDFSAVRHDRIPTGAVRSYERKDGTPVRGYTRRPRR
jgi:prophage maintenance system killer protein